MRDSRGFTLVELVVVMAIIAILVSISVPVYFQSRMRANEASATSTLNVVNNAQHAFAQTCGRQRFAPTFVVLGKPVPGQSDPFLSADLAVAEQFLKSGYLFRMGGTPAADGTPCCTGDIPTDGYQVTADPTNPGTTGGRFFGTNTTVVLFAHTESLFERMPETGNPELGSEIRGQTR